MLRQLNLPPETHLSLCDDEGVIDKAKQPWNFLPSGHKIGKPEPLFRELVSNFLFCCLLAFCPSLLQFDGLCCAQKDEEVESLRERYAGSQAERIEKGKADAKKIAEQLKSMKISGINSSCLL